MEKQQPGKFRRFLRKLRPNRAVYITAVTLLVTFAVIVAITVAANRSKKRPPDTSGTSGRETTSVTPVGDDTSSTPVTDKKPEDTKTPDTGKTTDAPKASSEPVVLTLPVSGTLTAYHDEAAQVWSDTMRDWRVHLGIDIATEANAPVYAAADGVVSQVWEDVRLGHCIAIKHGEDTYTVYRNLGNDPAEGIAEGVSVRAGQLIGSVGNSAMTELAEDPHLHLEMTVGGKQVNPLDYFDQTAIVSLNIDTSYEG